MISVTLLHPAAVSTKLPEAGDRRPETECLPHTAARVLLIVTLMAAPLAFGAVQPWAWSTMIGIVGCVLLLWALGCVRRGGVAVVWSPLYIPALALLVMAVVQLCFGLTLDRVGTREAILKLVTYVAIFFLTQQLFAGQSDRVWRMTAGGLAVYAFAMAVFAIIQFFASPGLLYGAIMPRWGGYIFGPYVNHNHYAGLMEMLIPITAAFTIGLHRSHPAKPFLVFSIFICLASLYLSGSRGGLVALAVEFALFAAVVLCAGHRKRDARNTEWKTDGFERGTYTSVRVTGNRQREVPKILLVACCLLLVAGIFLSWLDPGDVWKRWEQAAHQPEFATAERLKIVIDSIRISRAYLRYGVGLGAFEVAYPQFQTITTDHVIDYAHNDYAQLLAETGLIGWGLAPISIAMFAVLSVRRLSARLNERTGWIQLGAAVGVCGVLAHSFSDFNLHIPANAAWFAAMACMASLSPYAARKSAL